MILIKEFFRRSTTKIYLVLLTVIIVAITLLLNFSNYYKNIVNDVYLENSHVLITSTDELIDKLENNQSIFNIEQVAIVNHDETKEIDNYLLYDSISESIILTEATEEQEQNDITLNIIHFNYKNIEDIDELINKKVLLKNDNHQKEYNISSIKESKFNNISLSKEELDKFTKSQNNYTYLFKVTNYQEIDNIIKDLEEENDAKCLRLEYLETNAQVETIKSLEEMVPLLYNSSKYLMIAFTIILLLIIHNILSDEMDNMKLEWIIGFQRHNFFTILLSKIISLLLSTIVLSSLLYLLISYIILNVLEINVKLFAKEILYLIPITLIVSIIYITIFVIRNNYYLKDKRN